MDVALAALAGAVIGALAAILGPLLVDSRRRSHEAKLSAFEARNRALLEFVAALTEGAGHRGVGWGPELADLSRRINTAHLAFRMLIGKNEHQAARYVDALMLSVQRTQEVPSRLDQVNRAGLALSDWLRGVRSVESLRPIVQLPAREAVIWATVQDAVIKIERLAATRPADPPST